MRCNLRAVRSYQCLHSLGSPPAWPCGCSLGASVAVDGLVEQPVERVRLKALLCLLHREQEVVRKGGDGGGGRGGWPRQLEQVVQFLETARGAEEQPELQEAAGGKGAPPGKGEGRLVQRADDRADQFDVGRVTLVEAAVSLLHACESFVVDFICGAAYWGEAEGEEGSLYRAGEEGEVSEDAEAAERLAQESDLLCFAHLRGGGGRGGEEKVEGS